MSITPVLLRIDVGGDIRHLEDYTYTPTGAPSAAVSWHGAYPYLDTADGEGSYARTDDLTGNSLLAVRLSPFTPTDPLVGEFQIRFDFVGDNFPGFSLWDAALLPGTNATARLAQVTVGPYAQPGDEWVSGVVEFAVTPAIRDAAQRGDLIFARNVYNPYLVSQMNLRAGVVTYLRNFARDDGLGANPPRNFGGTSRQGSLRNFGYR